MNLNFSKNNIHFILIIFIIIISLSITNNQEYISFPIKFPSTLLLLNDQYAIVGQNGIYFYNKNLTILYKKINFTVLH